MQPREAPNAVDHLLWRLRTGYVGISYRILVRVDEDARLVQVMRIAHRAGVYRPE